ncbi:MAG: acylphosphatase, partial [Bacteroidales bacterium]|nr:acylphosphatase [Bacteroidales bacterium]
ASAMARYLGIHGFVRNEHDGSVYIEAEANRKNLDDFVRWCRKGPGSGYVESVSVTTADPCHHSKFQIRY